MTDIQNVNATVYHLRMITISYSLASLTEDFSWIPPVIIVTKVIIARKTIAPVYTVRVPSTMIMIKIAN